MDDRLIIQQLWQRLEQALEALAQKYGSRLYHTAMNILDNPQDAEEAVNDTYLAMWNTIPPQKPDPLSAYICRTGRNIALKRLRHQTAQKRHSRYDLSLDELAQCIPEDALEKALDARALGQAIDRFLDTVSKENQILFLRRYWFGDALKEIAFDLRIPERNASVQLHRLRTQLKDYLYKEGFFL